MGAWSGHYIYKCSIVRIGTTNILELFTEYNNSFIIYASNGTLQRYKQIATLPLGTNIKFLGQFSTKPSAGYYFAVINLPQTRTYHEATLVSIGKLGTADTIPISDFTCNFIENNLRVYTTLEKYAGFSYHFTINIS